MTKVPLNSEGIFAVIDAADAPLISGFKWNLMKQSRGGKMYAVAKSGGRTVYMHRLLMQPLPGFVVDHINGDGLDNRAANLRVCLRAQNNANAATKTHRKGVVQRKGGFESRLRKNGKYIYLGLHPTAQAAAAAYDRAAVEHFGQFARLNS